MILPPDHVSVHRESLYGRILRGGEVLNLEYDYNGYDLVEIQYPSHLRNDDYVGIEPDGIGITAEPQRHPSSQRFVEIASSLVEMHDQKQKDYGSDDDPFANVRSSEDFGMPAWVGCMVRANDKMKRIQKAAIQAVAGEEVSMANESLYDSLHDLAVYAVIGMILLEEQADDTDLS